MTCDQLLQIVEERLLAELGRTTQAPCRAWILVVDEQGIAMTEVTPEIAGGRTTSLIRDHLQNGAAGAAYITNPAPTPDRVFAELLVSKPENWEVRGASLLRSANGVVSLGPWEYYD